MSQMARAWVALLVLVGACYGSDPPRSTYYEREIGPILESKCLTAGGGLCHVNDGMGRANGNLDLSSFEGVKTRPDVLRRFGSYPFPLLLMKAVADSSESVVRIKVDDVEGVRLNIRHAGGPVLTLNDEAFLKLESWLMSGATENGLPPPPRELADRGPCSTVIRSDLFAQTTLDAVDIESDGYRRFITEVWPIIKGGGLLPGGEDPGSGCLGRECHGMRDTNFVPTNELYFTCGDDETQQRFNYLMARTYIEADGTGQLTQKPLAGGSYHDGGKPFASVDDPRYRFIRDWAAADSPYPLKTAEGQDFFEANVQPVLVANGCYLEACHSLVNFNFYKPLAGTDGHFGNRLSLHNYLQARFMLGLESEDPAQGRLLGKNILPFEGGIKHRGGPALAPIGDCQLTADQVRADPLRRWFEEETGGCIVQTWHRLERMLALENGELAPDPGAVGVFVRRPANPDRLIDFATYRPGADLLRMDLARDADGRVTGLAGAPTSLLGTCGVAVADADIRRPTIDRDTVVFAMRTSASEGLDLWKVGIDGSGCERLGLPGGSDSTGAPIHHFDPTFGPGGLLVFASTMADASHPDPARRYASVTPKYFLPNSNIWVFAEGGVPQRLSYLNGAELVPSLLHNREVTYALEKAAPDFYQISTRALRLDDGAGYRPQLGARPRMGYGQVTDVRELTDFRTAFIASEPGTFFGGGILGVHDLSLGLEELGYVSDGFFHPTEVLDGGAAVRPGETGAGVYRSPTPLPDGRILVAYSPGSVDLGNASANVDYGLWVVDPEGREAPWQLYDSPGAFDIEPVVRFSRIWVPQPARVHQGDPVRGEYVFHSIPMLGALLNDNTRMEGTIPVDQVARVRFVEQLPPPDGTTSSADVAADLLGPEQVYVKRRLIGEAPLLEDGSLRVMVPARTPIVLELLDADGNIIDWQREEEQIGPGETQPRVAPLPLFNAVCGGCHNALDGSELNVAVGPDVTTGASTRSMAARAKEAVDLYSVPDDREWWAPPTGF